MELESEIVDSIARQPCICSRLNFLLVVPFGLLGKLQDCRVIDQVSRWVGRALTVESSTTGRVWGVAFAFAAQCVRVDCPPCIGRLA